MVFTNAGACTHPCSTCLVTLVPHHPLHPLHPMTPPPPQLEKYSVTVASCNDALDLEPHSLKALYNRARARLTSPASGGVEIDLAVADLQAGLEECRRQIDGGTTGTVDVPLSTFQTTLGRVLRERKRQAGLDRKAFGGMFDRPDRTPLYDDSLTSTPVLSSGGGRVSHGDAGGGSGSGSDSGGGSGDGGRVVASGSGTSSGVSGGKRGTSTGVPKGSPGSPSGPTLAGADILRHMDKLLCLERDLRREGRVEDADQLRVVLDKARAGAVDKAPAPVDFSHPTPEMRAEAAKMG